MRRKFAFLVVFLLLFSVSTPLISLVAPSTSFSDRPLEIKTPSFNIIIEKQPWRLHVFDKRGGLIVEESRVPDVRYRPLSFYLDGWHFVKEVESYSREGEVYRFKCKTSGNMKAYVVLSVSDYGFNLKFLAPRKSRMVSEALTSASGSNRFYGFGERFNSLDQRGNTLEMWNMDPPKTFGTSTYVSVPFFMDLRNDKRGISCYGIYLNGSTKSQFKMCSDLVKDYQIVAESNTLEYHFIYGEDMKEVLSRYTGLTGRPALPPRWVFGPWKSRDAHYSEKDVYEDVNMMRRLDIPMSVLVIDSPWDTAFNDFEFNPEQFPNAQEMIDYIHGMGNKLVLWITPFTNVRSWVEVEGQKDRASNFDYADRNGYFAKDSEGNTMIVTWWKGDGGMIDFTNEDAKEWWQDQHKKLIEMGVDGFKTDDGEYVPYDAHFSNGKSGREMHNLYSLLYNEAIYEALNSSIDEHILFARSGFAGSQKYPAVWAGDQEGSFNYRDGLPAVIIAGQNMGMSGFSIWSHDVGGYRTPPDKNCFIRWAQFGCFSPIMQIHGQNREPWKFDDETVEIYRKYAKMHNSLFPYIYTYAKIANETGLPIMRSLVLLYPEDQNTYNQDFEYFFGNEFLVAPIYQNTTQRAVYLPDGEWIDYWNGTAYQGKQEVRYYAPLDKMPLFVKSGAIIPMISDKIDTLVPKEMVKDRSVVSFDDVENALILDVYPKEKSEFVMYDGTKCTCKGGRDKTVLKISKAPEDRTYLLKVSLPVKPKSVRVNLRSLPEIDSKGKIEEMNKYWLWDDSTGKVLIKIPLEKSGRIVIK